MNNTMIKSIKSITATYTVAIDNIHAGMYTHGFVRVQTNDQEAGRVLVEHFGI